MTTGLLLSLIINIGVGYYFAFVYPNQMRKRFPAVEPPPAFRYLAAVLKPLGLLLIAGSIAYGIYQLVAY